MWKEERFRTRLAAPVITTYRKKAVTSIRKFKNSTLETMTVMKSSELKDLMTLDLSIVSST